MKNNIGIGIIGTGNISTGGHIPAIIDSDLFNLTAVLSRDEISCKSKLDEFSLKATKVYNKIDDFVKDDSILIVIVCSPDGLHFEHTKKCLENGKHVILEKPMTTNIEDCEYLINLAVKRNLVLAIGFHLRHHVGHRLLKSKISNNEIGEVRHIRAIWAWPQKDDSNWRARNDLARWWSLAAVGTHCLDLVRWITNDFSDWKSFSSITSNSIWGGPHDESSIIACQLSSGITVEVVSSVQFGPYNKLEIFGSDGYAVCDHTFRRDGGGDIFIKNELIEYRKESPFLLQLNDIYRCIINNEKPISDANSGLINVRDLLLVGR